MSPLSLPTWIIHTTTLIEWIIAIELSWNYVYVKNFRKIIVLIYPMLLAFISALCACTWHIFNNTIYLEWLVVMQSLSTLLSNSTLFIALLFI
nr:hypothetical protein CVCH_106 [Cavernulicola chilensis]